MWVVDVFFKYKDVGGLEFVPHTGPIILAIAPHQNQFLDPIAVLHVRNTTTRLVRYHKIYK